MVRWAKHHGMTVTIHTGGPSIAGSSPTTPEVVLEADPRRGGAHQRRHHVDSEREIGSLVATSMALNRPLGDGRTALHALAKRGGGGRADRVIVGNDAPSGTGVVPLGTLRVTPTWPRSAA